MTEASLRKALCAPGRPLFDLTPASGLEALSPRPPTTVAKRIEQRPAKAAPEAGIA